jgi:hypothetical protein
LGIGDWGWGLGIGDWDQSPIHNPQSPIPIFKNSFIFNLLIKYELILIQNKLKIITNESQTRFNK